MANIEWSGFPTSVDITKTDEVVGLRSGVNRRFKGLALDDAVVHKSGNETIEDVKTFVQPIEGDITGNAATVTTNADLSGPITSSGNVTSITAGAIDLTTDVNGTLPISNGGTGQSTPNAALNALLPTQSGQSGKVLSTDGTNTSWIPDGSGSTTNNINNNGDNTITSTVNGVGSTTPIVLEAGIHKLTNAFGISINGFYVGPSQVVDTVELSRTGNELTSIVNSFPADPVDIIESVIFSKPDDNHITAQVNGIGNTQAEVISSISNSTALNQVTTTVNGITSAGSQIVTATSNTKPDTNHLVTSVNTVSSSPIQLVETNSLSLAGSSLKSTVNSLDSNSVIVQPAIGSPTNDNLVAMDSSGIVKDSGVSVTNSQSSNDNNHVMTSAAVQAAIAALASSGIDFIGGYDASTNLFPTVGSGSGGAVQKGDLWVITVSGTLGGTPVLKDDTLLALVNVPGQTASNWTINSASVRSVFGRIGSIVAQSGDYSVGQVTGAAPISNPTFTTAITTPVLNVTNNTNEIVLGTTNTTTITQSAITSPRTFTFPNSDSNPVVPSSAPTNQFATGISSSGVISYSTPTNDLSSSANIMTSIVSGVSDTANIINSNALDLSSTTLTSTVNSVVSSSVQVSPSPQSISSSISFNNLDERIVLIAPSVNAIGTYILRLKDNLNQELDVIFSICANQDTKYNYSSINIIQVNSSVGNITSSNISNFLLFRGYVRTSAPNSYFAVTLSMPNQLLFTNPVSMTVWQYGTSYLNESSTLSAMITNDISSLMSSANGSPDLIFKMKVNVVPVSSSNPQGYVYCPYGSSNAIFQYSINLVTGVLTALAPASISVTSAYKVVATTLRNYVYCTSASSIFQFRVNNVNGALSALSPASVSGPNTCTGIAIDPTDRFLYVCGFGTGQFGQFSITKSTGQLVPIASPPTAAGGMQELAIHPSGKFLYAINNINGNVYQYSINMTTGALTPLGTPTIAAGSGPIKIVIHPSGLYAYVLNNGSSTISTYAINTSTGQLTLASTFTSASPGNMYGLCISANGLFIYYTSQSSNNISVSALNLLTGSILAASSTQAVNGARECCFDFSGTYLYVVNNLNSRINAFTVNQTTGAMTSNGNVPGGANSISLIAI